MGWFGHLRRSAAPLHVRAAGLLGFSLSSCFAPPSTGPGAPTGTPAEAPAYLEGFIVELDGNYTRSDGEPIEIGKGCHIAKTTADSLLSDNGSVVVQWKQVPNVYFRIDALPGHHYRVERSVELYEGKYNVLLVVLRTFDPQGALVGQQKLAYGVDAPKERPSCGGQ